MKQVLKEELINELLRKNSTRLANSLSYIDVQEMVLDLEWKFDEYEVKTVCLQKKLDMIHSLTTDTNYETSREDNPSKLLSKIHYISSK